MPAAHVQSNSGHLDGAGSAVLAFLSNVVSGNRVLVTIYYDGGSSTRVSGITDTRSTSYTRHGGLDAPSGFGVEHWSGPLTSSGADTITIAFSATPNFRRVIITEVSGLGASPLDELAFTDITPATTTPTSSSVTPDSNGQYIYATYHTTFGQPTFTPGSGFTERIDSAPDNGALAAEDQVQATAGAIAPSFTSSTSETGTMVVSTWRAAAGAEPQGEVQMEGAGVTDRILLEDSSGVIQLEAGAESGTTFTASLSGGATPSGALTMRINKALTGAATPAGAVLKRGSKLLAGGATPAGALTKRGTQSMAGGATPAGALAALKLSMVSLAGGATPAGSLTKRGGKVLAGGATPAGSLTKRGSKAFAGGATPAGAVTMIRVILVSLAGSAAPSGTLTRRANKALAGGVTPTGALLKRVSKLLAGGVTPSGIALAQKVFLRSLSGSAGSSGTLTRRGGKALTGVVIPTGDVRLRAGKNLVGVLTPQGTLNRRHPLFLGGVVTPTGALTRAAVYRLSLGGVAMPIGTLTKRAHKFLGGGVTPSGILLIGSTLATLLVYDHLDIVPFTTLDLSLGAGSIEVLELIEVPPVDVLATFAGPDSSTVLPPPESGHTWQYMRSTWGIQGGMARMVTRDPGSPFVGLAVVDSRRRNARVEVTVPVMDGIGADWYGIAFRVISPTFWLAFAGRHGQRPALTRNAGGGSDIVREATAFMFPGAVLAVEFDEDVIRTYVDDVLQFTETLDDFIDASVHGLIASVAGAATRFTPLRVTGL